MSASYYVGLYSVGVNFSNMFLLIPDSFKEVLFGDSTRIKILCVLLKAEVCVCDLAEILGMTQSAISHQLRVLKQMKLVKNRREGKTVYYSLADGHIQNIISQGMEHIQE